MAAAAVLEVAHGHAQFFGSSVLRLAVMAVLVFEQRASAQMLAEWRHLEQQ